jgi:hypothetical protein
MCLPFRRRVHVIEDVQVAIGRCGQCIYRRHDLGFGYLLRSDLLRLVVRLLCDSVGATGRLVGYAGQGGQDGQQRGVDVERRFGAEVQASRAMSMYSTMRRTSITRAAIVTSRAVASRTARRGLPMYRPRCALRSLSLWYLGEMGLVGKGTPRRLSSLRTLS